MDKKKILYMPTITIIIIGSFLHTQFVYINFVYFRLSLFRMGVIFLFLIFLLNFINNGKLIINNKNKISISFNITWFLYAVISLLWVEDYFSWIKACWFIGCGMIICIMFSVYLKKIADFKKVLFIMSTLMIFQQIIGWYEMLTRNYAFNVSEDFLIRAKSYAYYPLFPPPVSFSGNPNGFATLMLFEVFLSYICLCLCEKKIAKIIYFSSMISSGILLYFTNSRANLIGAIIGIAFLALMLYRKKSKLIKSLILTASILCLYAFLPYIVNVFYKLTGLFNFDKNIINSDTVRLNLILNGIYFLFETVGFGVGAGNIEYWMATKFIYPTANITNMHNWWAEIFTAYGVFIFCFYIIFFIVLFLNFYKRYEKSTNRDEKTISLGFMCIMIAFIVGSMSSSSNIGAEWLWVFWAVAIAFQGYERYEEKFGLNNKKYNLIINYVER